MGRDQVKMSARTLHRLLAGDLPQEDFFRDHGKDARLKLHERIRAYLKSGRTIEKISIEKRADEDDDWVVLSFSGKPDAAISRFVSP